MIVDPVYNVPPVPVATVALGAAAGINGAVTPPKITESGAPKGTSR